MAVLRNKILILCYGIALAGGWRCSPQIIRRAHVAHSNNPCHLTAYTMPSEGFLWNEEIPSKTDEKLNAHLSLQALKVAELIGITPILARLLASENPNLSSQETVQLTQIVTQRLLWASMEVSAMAGEIDCEEEKADQVAVYLDNIIQNRQKKLTAGAIIIGAVGAIASGSLLALENGGDAPELIGIFTGLFETTLGGLILLDKPKIFFSHPRNALRDIWNAPTAPEAISPLVWRFLNSTFSPEDGKTLRMILVERWSGYGQLEKTASKKGSGTDFLYFGDGGLYTADALQNRANMLDQLESYINLMKQSLAELASALNRK